MYEIYFLDNEIIIFWGDITDISAKIEPLPVSQQTGKAGRRNKHNQYEQKRSVCPYLLCHYLSDVTNGAFVFKIKLTNILYFDPEKVFLDNENK